jgi:radical SAM protein with 4Fe4S-binding SPASM domain
MPVAEQRLVLSDRVRFFTHRGRHYAHVSGVPLAYLALTPAWQDLFRRYATPQRPTDVVATPLSSADQRFLTLLVRAGVLVDADRPDPIHGFRGAEPVTRTLYLYPTNSCNLRCVYCYATSGPGAGPRLSVEHALLAVDDFFASLDDDARVVQLKFHGGGEPTTNATVMREAWERFRTLSHERGLPARVTTITNGTFGPEVLRMLSAPEWGVTVSYDGPRQAAQRPTAADRDSRDRVVANLRALAATGKALSTRATLTRDGLPSLRALVDDAAEVGITRVQVEPASIVGRGSNLTDGPPDPVVFAEAFVDTLPYALAAGVELTTSAWTHLRVGDGRYCGAITGSRALTPDGFVSACTESCDGSQPDDPFIVGRLDVGSRRLEIWPVRESALQSRTGYALPHCSSCYLVDTCAGGCASKARADTGNAFDRDEAHCVASRIVNPAVMADLADGRLLPDAGWQPFGAVSGGADSALPDGRLVGLVPRFARSRWNTDPARRPLVTASAAAPMFVHLP